MSRKRYPEEFKIEGEQVMVLVLDVGPRGGIYK
jgi:hypothetical protein